MPATTSRSAASGLPVTALTGAASLLTAAALVNAAGAIGVSVTVSELSISVQVCQRAGDPAARAAAVAAYAQVLRTPVVCKPAPGTPDTWVETHAEIGGHPVHVWTLIHGQEA